MTERAALADRHLRLLAGLWFAAWMGSASLLMSLVVSVLMTKYSRGTPLPQLDKWLAFGLVLGTASVAGGWLGPELLKRGTSAVEAVRRGAWIGILTGLAQVLLGVLLKRVITFEGSPSPGSLYTAGLWLVMSAVFRAGWLLPIGALAGSSLVRVTQLIGRSEREGRKK